MGSALCPWGQPSCLPEQTQSLLLASLSAPCPPSPTGHQCSGTAASTGTHGGKSWALLRGPVLQSGTPALPRGAFPMCLASASPAPLHGNVSLLKSPPPPPHASHHPLGQCPSCSYRLLGDGSLHLFLATWKAPLASPARPGTAGPPPSRPAGEISAKASPASPCLL